MVIPTPIWCLLTCKQQGVATGPQSDMQHMAMHITRESTAQSVHYRAASNRGGWSSTRQGTLQVWHWLQVGALLLCFWPEALKCDPLLRPFQYLVATHWGWHFNKFGLKEAQRLALAESLGAADLGGLVQQWSACSSIQPAAVVSRQQQLACSGN